MKYYLNTSEELHNPSHTHKVHRENCYWLPTVKNRKYLGDYARYQNALEYAKNLHSGYCPIDGCKRCCCPYIYDDETQLNLFH